MTYDPEVRRTVLRDFMKVNGLREQPWEIAAGVGQGTIRAFLKGRTKSLTDKTYEKLAQGASKVLGAKVFARELRGEVLAPDLSITVPRHVPSTSGDRETTEEIDERTLSRISTDLAKAYRNAARALERAADAGPEVSTTQPDLRKALEELGEASGALRFWSNATGVGRNQHSDTKEELEKFAQELNRQLDQIIAMFAKMRDRVKA